MIVVTRTGGRFLGGTTIELIGGVMTMGVEVIGEVSGLAITREAGELIAKAVNTVAKTKEEIIFLFADFMF